MDISTIIALVSVVVAGLSALFAFNANRSAQKAAIAHLLFELNKHYQEISGSSAIGITWGEYKSILKQEHGDKADLDMLIKSGTEIEMNSARAYIKRSMTGERDKEVELAVNKTFWYWHILSTLVEHKIISAKTAITSFGDPGILGFLYPIDRAWVEYYSSPKFRKHYLNELHEAWVKSQKN